MKLHVTILFACIVSLSSAQNAVRASHYRRAGEPAAPPIPVELTTSDSGLTKRVETTYSKEAQQADGARGYKVYKAQGGLWHVAATESCKAEVGPRRPLGHALPCRKDQTCSITVTETDTQTFSNTLGFHTDFSVEAGGGAPGVFEVKTTVTSGMSQSYTHEFGTGVAIAYAFSVPPGTACAPSVMSYVLSCLGSVWWVKDEIKKVDCKELDIDFKAQARFFKRDEDGDESYYYVNHSAGKSELWGMAPQFHNYFPKNCDQVVGPVWIRPMEAIQENSVVKASLSLKNGKSLSALGCFPVPLDTIPA